MLLKIHKEKKYLLFVNVGKSAILKIVDFFYSIFLEWHDISGFFRSCFHMKCTSMRALGIILIIGGIFMLFFTKISFAKTEDVANANLLGMTQQQSQTTALTFYTSGIAVLSGVIVVLAAKKKID